MIGIDTNVLVRYIVQDDKKQSKKAEQYIEKNCTLTSPGFINSIVICELVWVLETAYEYTKEQIANVIEKILTIRQFHINNPEIVWHCLQGYRENTADFADHYIANMNIKHECEFTITFDKKASRLNHMKLLQD